MDLSTIRKKINENKYTTTEDIYKDIQLIWDNCKHYNVEGSDVFKMAIHCEKFTKRYKTTNTPHFNHKFKVDNSKKLHFSCNI